MAASKGGLSRGLFIAASTVMILTGIAHTIAALKGEDPPENDQQRQLMDLMKTVPIKLPGANRTMLELFQGFGWHFSLSVVAIAVIGLIVACGSPGIRRSYAGAAAVFMAVMTVNSVIFFFLIPTAFMGLSALLYAAAFLSAPKQAEPEIQA